MKKPELSAWVLVAFVLLILGVSIVLSPISGRAQAEPGVDDRKVATEVTKSYNQQFYDLPFANDQQDYDNAEWGFIAQPDVLTIAKREITECYPGNCAAECTSFGDACEENAGELVWDLESYKDYIVPTAPPVDNTDAAHRAPETVNPSLWRNAQLNMKYGLFRVAGTAGPNSSDPNVNLQLAQDDRESSIYQVRGYDLSNITFVKGTDGWIVFDPLISPETAEAAFEFLNEQIPWKNQTVSVVIYSHSHVDHYGGAPGLFGRDMTGVDYEDPVGVEFIAPEGFTEHAVSENVIAGNAMARRAIYMYGALLERDVLGGVNGGLGQTTSTGEAGLIQPTIIVLEEDEILIDDQGQPLGDTGVVHLGDVYQGKQAYSVDGVEMIFQMTPGTEAPSEMNTWIPLRNALWMAENTTNTMHNILTLRGAQVRDASKWVSFLSETIRDWGALAEVKFQSHHWPLWASAAENSEIVSYLEKQRDAYKFVHDQTVRLMNNGYTGEEISEKIEWLLPDSLKNTWSTRGYYGTLRHNSRAVYQFYMGWYDGHPSDLNNLPPEEVAVRYVNYIESEGTLYEKALADFNKAGATVADYRWVAEVMKHAVFADPGDTQARELLADVLEQLGYMAESGPWRSVYLQGAYELRNANLQLGGTQTATPDTIRAMPPEMIFDYLAVHLCTRVIPGEDDCSRSAADSDIVIEMHITDWNPPAGTHYVLTVRNGILNYEDGQDASAGVKLTTTMAGLQQLLIDQDGSGITVNAGQNLYNEFVQMLDLVDDFQFNIVTP